MLQGKEYYEKVWEREKNNTWRRYPGAFGRIRFFVGSGKKVLDVGCGAGILLSQLKENGNTCTGVEISEVAVEIVKKKGMECVLAQVPPLPFEDEEFDVVVATEMFEHVEKERMLLRECVRVCKKGGWVIVGVPNDCLGPDVEPEHVRKYNKGSLKTLLEKVGGSVFVDVFRDEFSCPDWIQGDGSVMNIGLPTLLGRCKK